MGLALLTGPGLGKDRLRAALLAYRGLYYFVPLVLAWLPWVQQNCAGARVQQLLPKIRANRPVALTTQALAAINFESVHSPQAGAARFGGAQEGHPR